VNLLFDTNIILTLIRSNNYDDIIGLLNPDSVPIYISVVSEAEIKSIAIQNNWGINRRNKLNLFLDNVNIVEISQMFVNTYTEIDSYSQCRNPAFVDYPFFTHRNMGKNDLWIASLAALLGLQLVTTDGDFDHLNGVFFDVQKLTPTL
jgi:tRNA(fMet)-specific endonuclease VapC